MTQLPRMPGFLDLGRDPCFATRGRHGRAPPPRVCLDAEPADVQCLGSRNFGGELHRANVQTTRDVDRHIEISRRPSPVERRCFVATAKRPLSTHRHSQRSILTHPKDAAAYYAIRCVSLSGQYVSALHCRVDCTHLPAGSRSLPPLRTDAPEDVQQTVAGPGGAVWRRALRRSRRRTFALARAKRIARALVPHCTWFASVLFAGAAPLAPPT